MDDANSVSSLWTQNEVTVRFTWYPGDNPEKYRPYTQVYGVCFSDKGQILIQKVEDSDWCLAGGTVEIGESPEDTLRRELIEEADVTIKNPIMLGGQKVEYLSGHNPNPKKGGDEFFQLRYYCEVDEVLPQTPDPDHGKIHDRLFVDPSEITKYFDWGATGAAIFKQATELYRKFHYHEDGELRVEGERHAGIVIRDNKVLLIHRIKNGHEYWVFPGGHRRKEDSGENTAEREILEETNITARCTNLVFKNGQDYYYTCQWVSGEKPELIGEEKVKNSKENFYEPTWIELNKISELNIVPEYAKNWLVQNNL